MNQVKKCLFVLMIVALLTAACASSEKATHTPKPAQVVAVTDTPRSEPTATGVPPTETPPPAPSAAATLTPSPTATSVLPAM